MSNMEKEMSNGKKQDRKEKHRNMRKKQKIEVEVIFKSGNSDKCTEAMLKFFERNPHVGEPKGNVENKSEIA